MLSVAWLATTILAYFAGHAIARAARSHALANPTAIAILIVGSLIVATHTTYEAYFAATWPLTFLLVPATVALGIPLARHLRAMRHDVVAIAAASTFGAVASMLTGVAIVRCLGGDRASVLAILPKAATSPVAMAIASEIGGHPSLTASLSIAGGIVAAMALPAAMSGLRLGDWRATGLAAGIAGSGIGAAQVAGRSETAAAFAAIGIGVCAIVTAVCAPIVATIVR